MGNSTKCNLFVPSPENKIQTVLITYPRDLEYRKTIINNLLCIVLHLMYSTIIGRFLEVMFDCTQ